MKDRLASMLVLLDHPDPATALGLLCERSVDELDMTGAGVAAIVGDDPVGILAAAGHGIEVLADHLVATEGPAWDAHRSGRAVRMSDVSMDDRWPGVRKDAAAAGVAALFAQPLRLGSVRFGALVLVRDRPGDATSSVWDDVSSLADVAVLLVLSSQAQAGLGDLGDSFEVATQLRAVVHQAAGMVSVQLGIDIAEAHLALRSKAWELGRSTTDLARAVVRRELRFTDG